MKPSEASFLNGILFGPASYKGTALDRVDLPGDSRHRVYSGVRMPWARSPILFEGETPEPA